MRLNVESQRFMDTNTVDTKVIELQKQVQKLEKLEKMINPNSKKSLILWEEDDSFKSLISSIVKECDTEEAFPIELLDKLNALKEDVDKQLTEGKAKVAELNVQAAKNLELSRLLSTIYISAMAASPLDEFEPVLTNDGDLACMNEYIQTISMSVPDSEEYKKAEKTIKSKISNLENSVHITIDLERTTSKAGALEYIRKEIAPAIVRLQSEYDAKYAVVNTEEENVEMSLAIRKTFKEKVYDAIVKPFANLFKWKKKARN